VVVTAVSVFAAIAVALFGATLAGVDSLPLLMAGLFLGFGCLGLVIPSTAVLALEHHGAIAGTASALLGTLQLVCGAVVVALVSAFFDGTPLPMVAAIAACAVVAMTLSHLTLRRSAVPAAAE
jgi:DHA1 family bicyclomycin/chloramphenicol resistance-like MFS transporter